MSYKLNPICLRSLLIESDFDCSLIPSLYLSSLALSLYPHLVKTIAVLRMKSSPKTSLNFERIYWVFESNLGDSAFKTIRKASIYFTSLSTDMIPAICFGSLPCESPKPGVSIKYICCFDPLHSVYVHIVSVVCDWLFPLTMNVHYFPHKVFNNELLPAPVGPRTIIDFVLSSIFIINYLYIIKLIYIITFNFYT